MQEEVLAQRIFRSAGIPEVGHLGVGDLAVALIGRDCIEFADQDRPVVVRDIAPQILLRRGMARDALGYAIAAGIVEWWRRSQPGGLHGCSPSGVAEYLVIPTAALDDATRRLGTDPATLACEFACPVQMVKQRIAMIRARPSSQLRLRRVAS